MDPGYRRVVNHILTCYGRLQALGVPDALHFDAGIDQEEMEVLLEIHVRKSKGPIRPVDCRGCIYLVVNPDVYKRHGQR